MQKGSADFFRDAVEQSATGKEACDRIYQAVYQAKSVNKLPEMSDVVAITIELAAKHPSGDKRKVLDEAAQFVHQRLFAPKAFVNNTLFFPNQDHEKEIVRYLRYAKKYLWVVSLNPDRDLHRHQRQAGEHALLSVQERCRCADHH
jgi:hypothetical protein